MISQSLENTAGRTRLLLDGLEIRGCGEEIGWHGAVVISAHQSRPNPRRHQTASLRPLSRGGTATRRVWL